MTDISVVIPFYSAVPGLLIKSVRSALSQTIQSIEILVIDDASPISAKRELESIKDTRLRIIRHIENSNGGIARNTGIEAAVGKYIAFLDYDDIWYRDKLSKQLAAIKSNANSLNDLVVYSRCKIIEQDLAYSHPKRAIKEDESVGDYLFVHKQLIQTSGIFLSRILAQKVKFDDLKRHQDYQFCLALESIGAKFVFVDEDTYEFVQIPKLNDYNFSTTWLINYQSMLTPSACLGFKKLVILRSMVSHGHFYKAVRFSIKNRFLSEFSRSVITKIIKGFFPKRITAILIKMKQNAKIS
ncbi:glycosyltransferase [Shewanella abyssi]|uniref:glycosyltransferase family 2 protein n=1 Tax=Shewanella abyssi TaxID=311789 RepID=UPI00200CCB55|nr:glycosyltransferase family 2 protein [Shewanella abyssi]MCL1049584.1 glycosyltransferase [Shewanella abyssi]